MEGSRTASLLACPVEMDQDYERRLLRQINHQNLPAETRLAKVRDGRPQKRAFLATVATACTS